MSEKDFDIEFTTGLEEEELPELNKMAEDWDTYVTYLDDEKALIMVDLEVAKVAPVLSYKFLFGIQIAIKNPTPDGFYTAEEQPRLFEIEDRVATVYRDEAHAKHIASITTGGTRMLYFYAKTILIWLVWLEKWRLSLMTMISTTCWKKMRHGTFILT